jgi:hypothetical protein
LEGIVRNACVYGEVGGAVGTESHIDSSCGQGRVALNEREVKASMGEDRSQLVAERVLANSRCHARANSELREPEAAVGRCATELFAARQEIPKQLADGEDALIF